ncbi:ABC transporter permease [Actinotalea sp. M2MS4P-6]|uniref:ABC transporter permease n=1 Tax=Actinotalea sp. M2MS4P-6 TaxID=2983762 RepID=UPI0021E4E284|nr:ABC transporter permease [Actinotalea sp. M2MS4P-6]MCV2393597.1 ABC transporter permease [Actinotalea sp. M2MS4P-6]
MSAVVHTAALTARQLRAFLRVPAFFAMNLVQPLIWLLLFGQLFRSVAQIPGFTGGDYLTFLTPGVVMMMAMFGAAWTGAGYIQDMERGVMDRLLTSPTSRTAMIVSTLAYQSVLTVLQTAVLLVVAWTAGVRFDGGAVGVGVLVLAAVLLTVVFGALSDAVALVTRQHNALIGISQLLAFPVMFLSSAIMDVSLAPSWVGAVARLNPFEWAVVAGREAVSASTDWGSVLVHLGLLAAAGALGVVAATAAFRVYRRSA